MCECVWAVRVCEVEERPDEWYVSESERESREKRGGWIERSGKAPVSLPTADAL